jgi:hypothetical protein
MRLPTILAFVLAVAFAAADPFTLLIKRDSTSSMTSTTSTDLPAARATWYSTLTTGIDSSSSPYTSTDWLETTMTESTDPSETSQSHSEPSEEELDGIITNAMSSCHPHNATGKIDFNAPCNQFVAITDQCSYGPQTLDILSQSQDIFTDFIGPEWQEQSPETERTCLCQSQIADVASGCAACLKAHGHPFINKLYKGLYHPTMFQQYCDADFTVTQGFGEFSNEAWESRRPDPGEVESYDAPYTGEPLSTSTEVYLYYTLSVTRSDVHDIAVPTPDSASKITYTTTRISDGQIVPTAQAEKEVKEQDPGEAGTSSISIKTSGTSSVSSTRSLGVASPSRSQSYSADERDSEEAAKGCYPSDAAGHLDFNAPCNQAEAILLQCAYGPPALSTLNPTDDSDEYLDYDPDLPKLSPETERTCVCQSQLTDVTIGCLRCVEAHQLRPKFGQTEASFSAAMQQYCDVDYTTKQSFSDFLAEASSKCPFEYDAPPETHTTEVISTSTDVSLYYTLSVTRSDAFNVALPTPAVSGGDIIYTSTRTSGGQIVPTARDVRDPKSPTTDSGAGAMHAEAVGMLAIAALAALGL